MDFLDWILIALATLLVTILILVVVCFIHYFTDPYDMKSAMNELKVLNSGGTIERLKEIRERMVNCPPIGKNVSPIEVIDYDKLKVLIAGDSNGTPRLFAYNRGENSTSYYHKIRKDETFKKYGLKYSVDADGVLAMITEAEKIAFQKKLEENSQEVIQKHFSNLAQYHF